jgi:hypothetical protein
MSRHNLFVYVFRLKPNVVVPAMRVDYSQLTEDHYMCIHKYPVAELLDMDLFQVVRHMHEISIGPQWYKRGLTPLTTTDVVWCNGIGSRLLFPIPEEGMSLQDVNLDPEKILSCKG